MAITGFKMEVTGVGELVERLKEISTKKAKNAVRRSVSRGATVLLQTARPLVTNDSGEGTGLLRKSLGKKDSSHKSSKVFSLVGPRRGFKEIVAPKLSSKYAAKLRKKGQYRAVKGKLKDPVRYAHLVGGGHKIAGGKGFVRPRPSMVAAQLIARQQMSNIMQLVLTQALMAEAKTATPDI